MIDHSKLWKPHSVARSQTLELELGSLHLWVHRGLKDWHLAHESNIGADERFSLSLNDDAFAETREWTRWILDEQIKHLHLRPQLPDRPIIVRPEMPVCLMPKQSVQFFIGIPIWLAITFGAKHEKAIEIPTEQLSNSWFGQFTEGELCYAIKTTARLSPEGLLPSPQRAIFPLEVRNNSQEKLNFERLCIRPQYLNIFQGKSRLWTSKGRVSYRGEDNWSRFVYASGAPEFEQATPLIGKARDTQQRGAILKTFDNFKQRVEL